MNQPRHIMTKSTACLALAMVFLGQMAWAHHGESSEGGACVFRMSVVLDRAEGKTISQGNYERAIVRIVH